MGNNKLLASLVPGSAIPVIKHGISGLVAGGDGNGCFFTSDFTEDNWDDLGNQDSNGGDDYSSTGIVSDKLRIIGDSTTAGQDSGAVASADTNPYSVSVDVKSSKFAPVPITSVQTAFGTFNFVAHPLFRGHAEDKCAVIDLANVAYRPLVGNGLNRDTFVETNIQDNSVDGRKDQIITECGLEIMLPETHALLSFTGL